MPHDLEFHIKWYIDISVFKYEGEAQPMTEIDIPNREI